MRDTYVRILVEEGLLPQVVRELLALSTDANYVDVVDGDNGRMILAHPEVADAWFEAVTKDEAPEVVATEEVDVTDSANEKVEIADSAIEETPEVPDVVVPIKRGPGRPRKAVPPPLSYGEESA
jgi:hypothetical protein